VYSQTSTRATPSMARIIQFVADYHERFGFAPSTGDMAKSLRLEKSWCARVASAAAARGLLLCDPGIARSWRLPPSAGRTPATVAKPRKRRT
jgi:hypothetical protein